MTPQAEIQIIETIVDEVEHMSSVEEVIAYLSDRLIYTKDQEELEEVITTLSNEDPEVLADENLQ